jgi:hypothetical protein
MAAIGAPADAAESFAAHAAPGTADRIRAKLAKLRVFMVKRSLVFNSHQ